MSTAQKQLDLKVSKLAENIIGSEIIKLAAEVNEKIKNGEINDVDLKPFDIIEVTFKGRIQRKYPPVIALSENKADTEDLPLRIIDWVGWNVNFELFKGFFWILT